MTSTVEVRSLRKVYQVPVREEGVKASVRALVGREYRDVVAVDDINLDLAPGEIVGFLGPNGAGKTTTIKMLTGLLFPTSGDATVLGHQPWKRERILLSRIALVMGQRYNLQWDLPATDSFALNKAIYGIPEAEFRTRVAEYAEMLDLTDLLVKPVRNLSLGERMKMEIVGALLHRPEVLFLDEPTLGLDVTMQKRLRAFISHYNQETGATVLLTSHYMADVTALADRVVVIHHGSIVFEGGLAELTAGFASHKTIGLAAEKLDADLSRYGTVVRQDAGTAVIEVHKSEVSKVAAALLDAFEVTDLTIEDPPLEEVIDRLFTDTNPSG